MPHRRLPTQQKGDSHLLCEAPYWPFRQKVAVTFLRASAARATHQLFSATDTARGYFSSISRQALRRGYSKYLRRDAEDQHHR